MDDLKAKILAEIKANEESMKLQPGDILIDDVVQASGVSDKTAIRILKELARTGEVTPVRVRVENGYLRTAYRPKPPTKQD